MYRLMLLLPSFVLLMLCRSHASLQAEPIDVRHEFDFSHCGYAANNRPIPYVKAIYRLEPPQGDATQLIQDAIDRVSALPLDESGFRGAVLLAKGTFQLSGSVLISNTGVVLRGSGDSAEGTVLLASGDSRRSLLEIKGADCSEESTSTYQVVDAIVGPGSQQVTLDSTAGLAPGDSVFIVRPSKKEWISALGMDQFIGNFDRRLNWAEGSRDIAWDRTITHLEGNTVFFAGPIASEIDARFGSARLVRYHWPGRVENAGIENLRCVSEYHVRNKKDEEHSWIAVHISNARNVWVRDMSALHFAGSAVMLQPTTSHVTIDRCRYLEPISELGGLRRISYYNGGQLNLIRDCYAQQGRHDFVVGFCSAGPNVFKDCISESPLSFSGSIESWACGALFDNVQVVGNAIKLTNLKKYLQGSGWSASNCVLWNCEAAEIAVENPPFSVNYVFGGAGSITGNSFLAKKFRRARPLSLFDDQIGRRLAAAPTNEVDYRAEIAKEKPRRFQTDSSRDFKADRPKQTIEIRNGRFICGGRTLWGGHYGTDVWEGSLAPHLASRDNPSVTRFVPGREGRGLTDDLQSVVDLMASTDRPIMALRPGLWYDRRRDDHMVVKRMDGNVWGPFLEMPWARSGEGRAWDGLSKYDLTKFNPWYFRRIREFTELCDKNGLLVYHELYNNHNLVESASHWVDFPWRPVNCIQDTGITEPPPYDRGPPTGDRLRIHVADQFYDASSDVKRELHTLYIRKCLDNSLGQTNVLFTMGHQYAGNLAFTRFFLDVVREWQQEHRIEVKLAMQTGKNVTDAILEDPAYSSMISVIDMRYWQYFVSGELYAPKAGVNKAYRELRQLHNNEFEKGLPPSTPQLLYRQVSEYQRKYPQKAIIAYVQGVGPLPILMAGGAYSIYQEDGLQTSPGGSSFDGFVRDFLADDLWNMTPNNNLVGGSSENWCLAREGEIYLLCSLSGSELAATLQAGNYKVHSFDHSGTEIGDSGELIVTEEPIVKLSSPNGMPWLSLIRRIP